MQFRKFLLLQNVCGNLRMDMTLQIQNAYEVNVIQGSIKIERKYQIYSLTRIRNLIIHLLQQFSHFGEIPAKRRKNRAKYQMAPRKRLLPWQFQFIKVFQEGDRRPYLFTLITALSQFSVCCQYIAICKILLRSHL